VIGGVAPVPVFFVIATTADLKPERQSSKRR
jgi:hypothetical protein